MPSLNKSRIALPDEGRRRVVIENVAPCVDAGRFAAKRCIGEALVAEADCYCDGHEIVTARVRYRHSRDAKWQETRMTALEQDRFRGAFPLPELGIWYFTIVAWIDRLQSWRRDFMRREIAEDMISAAQLGAQLIAATAEHAPSGDRDALSGWAARLRAAKAPEELHAIGADEQLAAIADRHARPELETQCDTQYPVVVERARAGYSAWYEIFPRSTGNAAEPHGSFRSLIAHLPYIAAMGFDVLYLPPIHPIGRTHRKGKNNTTSALPDDVGSPWAIGSPEGGHTAIHRSLGTEQDFRELAEAARGHGMEIALDIAFQMSPDHPYVSQHPEWFRHRPDGSIQYAENPPKRYQDIYPLNFESDAWKSLWAELKHVLDFWIARGVRVFRVDNPHTKPFAFWEWLIASVQQEHPDVIFLSEAFTRPKVMQRLAKLGFSQSYTYFTWRNSKRELTEYFSALTSAPLVDYFRPNCWPNTPDILPEFLQHGGRPAFSVRLALAATLSANYGIYGPAFELMQSTPRDIGGEEYLDSEKYELKRWELEREDSLAGFIQRINRIRRGNPALHADRRLAFHGADDDAIICYSKTTASFDNVIVVVANLDPYQVRGGRVRLELEALGIRAGAQYQMHELITGARYLWSGSDNSVRLDPAISPVQIFRVRQQLRSEHDFDYFL